MTRRRKAFIIVLSVLTGLLLLFLTLIVVGSRAPGIDGFTYSVGMLRLINSEKPYIKVGENRYLFREGELAALIEGEYENYFFKKETENYKDQYGETLELADFYNPGLTCSCVPCNERNMARFTYVQKDEKTFIGKHHADIAFWHHIDSTIYAVYFYEE